MKDFSDLTVIIPTLNEKDDVPRLIGILSKNYRGIRVIVSDDGSKDGTKDAVLKISRRNSNVSFLDRKHASVHGLTASVVDAVKKVKTKKIIVMDGDLQHPPSKVRTLSGALERNDIAIGVRSSIKDWGLHRRIISMSVSTFVWSTFKIRGKHTTSDMMSGFFGIRSSLFKRLVETREEQFVGKGYKVLLDILRIADRDSKIAEVRYNTFHDRVHGKSKLKMLGMKQMPHVFRSTLR